MGMPLAVCAAHKWTIKDQSKSPRGSVHMDAEKAGKVLRITIAGRAPRVSLSAATSVAISPDGKQVVTGSTDGMAYVWKLPAAK